MVGIIFYIGCCVMYVGLNIDFLWREEIYGVRYVF